jgi:hypothetical protein
MPPTNRIDSNGFKIPQLGTIPRIRFAFEVNTSKIFDSRLLGAKLLVYDALPRLIGNGLPNLTRELDWIGFWNHTLNPSRA